MADLATLANYAEVLGAAAVAGGVAFAVWQVRQLRVQRRDASAIEVVHAIQSPEFHDAMDLVMTLPVRASPGSIDAQPAVSRAVNSVGYVFETFGVLVYYRVVDLHLLDNLWGGFVRGAWARLQPYAEHRRRALGSPSLFEWFQWLAERLDEDPAPGKAAGAHVAHRSWRR